MVMANFSLINHAQSIIGCTVAQSIVAAATPSATPAWFSIDSLNPNAQTSTTIAAATYGPGQGNCSNPTGKMGEVEPVGFVTPENQILQQANSLRVANGANGTLWL